MTQALVLQKSKPPKGCWGILYIEMRDKTDINQLHINCTNCTKSTAAIDLIELVEKFKSLARSGEFGAGLIFDWLIIGSKLTRITVFKLF